MNRLINFSYLIDRLILKISRFFSFFSLPLIFAITLQVLLRYVFFRTNIKLEELQWHLYGFIIIFGLVYCENLNSHVRVDVIHGFFSKKLKNYIEFLGIIFLFFPFCFVVFFHGIDYTIASFKLNESSSAPSGLPFRWFMKGVIPFGFFVLFWGGVSRLIKIFAILINFKENHKKD